jgi:hypothetical protein
MIHKLSPQPEVSSALANLIKKSMKHWSTIALGNCSFDSFNTMPLPKSDSPFGYFTDGSTYCKLDSKLIELGNVCQTLGASENTNLLVYGSNSCMGWHTNSDLPGDRIYYTFTTGTALFRYLDSNGRIVDDWDNINAWTVRKFSVQQQKPLWHTIWTEKIRFSFGFRIVNVT